MLSADENPGVIYFLVGMVILVMAGVGLSLILDKKIKASSGGSELKRELASAEHELLDLHQEHDLGSRRLAEQNKRSSANAAVHDELLKCAVQRQQRRTVLAEQLKGLEAEITFLEEAFTRYRADYRSKTWASAAGERIGRLPIRGGRDFVDVQIIRVTEAGLEIRHAHGIARVQAPDLDPSWHERFQWSDVERRRLLRTEVEHSMLTELPDRPNVDSARISRPDGFMADNQSTDIEDLKLLRQHVLNWRARVSQLTIDQREASTRAGYGSQTSVPGSLETWSARAVRLNNELSRAQLQLAAVKARLASAAPNDSLLRQSTLSD